ncbi:MAG: protein kinase [Myxococcales bacterium]|nr:protein kinase [Myxococcales bacterium]
MVAPAPSIRIASYELFERLGEGGSGQVYRAQTADGTAVAVKLLGPAADLDPEAAHARFRREVDILRGLDHPALVTLVDHGVDDELGPYLVMPLVPGQTLRGLLSAGVTLCPEAAVLLLEPVASAIAALHERSLIHRDLKPENVMIAPDGRVVVVDLGLAWGPELSRHTAEGTAVGSVPYMAPEQIEGSGVGTAADVWALAVMLYELIAGKRPFARTRASEEAAAALVGSYAPLDAVDPRCAPELARLVAQSLDRAPLARPAVAVFAAELRGAIDWIDDADRQRERAAIANAPAEYVKRVAPFRVRREKRLAREAIAAARPFQALAHVDRALAYAPTDPELLSLADEAEAKSSRSGAPAPATTSVTPSVEVATPVEVKRRRSALGPMIAVAVLAAGFAAAVSWIALRGRAKTEAETTETPVAVARDAGVPDALVTVPPPGKYTSPVPGLVALDVRGIPNDLPSRLDEMRAPPGENIFPQDRLEEPDPVKAMASIDADVAKNPDRSNRLGQAVIYLAAGRTDEGLAKLDRVLADFPDYGNAWAAKGYVEVRRGRAREAEEAMTRAIEIDPDDHESYRNRGILRDHQGRARDAYADLMAALERDPTDVEAMAELAQVYSAAGHRDEARPLLERIVRLRPQSVTGWLDLSLMQPTPEAIESIRHALAIEPQHQRANVRMCTVLAEAGAKDAVAQCTRAVQLAPGDPWAWMGRGLARYQLANDRKGLDDVDRAIQMKPDHAQFHVNRYILRSHAGMLPEAKADLTTACKLGASEACTQLKKL